MSAWIIIAAALLLIVLVLRFLFKLTGLIIKLLLLAAIGFTLWWLFSGM